MKIHVLSGLVAGVRQVGSPNFDARPQNVEPEVIIVHSISLPPGQYGGKEVEDLFCNRLDCQSHPYFHSLENLRVSAHFLVRRDGEVIQFVSLNKRAWHAGVSFCIGRENVNDFSIGIELEGCDDDEFEDNQYDSLNSLIELLLGHFSNMDYNRIFGHSDIAPDRKTDPGPNFDWPRIGVTNRTV
ncbi:MAG: 1,6-anhydro-N-acetylmuramyl-L-alanine amidase AmpD [Acidiferrobacterales bacterium]|nr:1,6-anhydro-N-acetylmuramyl-L-alanine amidase AmpD [Acidiferrobacterales bacterium]